MKIHLTTAPKRPKPRAGDMRWLKGRKVWQIRMQRRVPAGMPHAGAGLVSNGRPLYHWVDRHSVQDHLWFRQRLGQWSPAQQLRQYMEEGCLCMIEGRLKIDPYETHRAAAARYLAQCTCSRHPDYGVNK